jgi:hypothetical protein
VAKLTIDVRELGTISSGKPFDVAVVVDGGPPGASVNVRLRQTQGKPPFFTGTAKVILDANGIGEAVFKVTLFADVGTTSNAVLEATASDAAGTHYASDSKAVEVEG